MSGELLMRWTVDSGVVTLQFPPSMSEIEIDEVLEVIHLQMRGMRRKAIEAAGKNPGELEYASWAVHNPSTGETAA